MMRKFGMEPVRRFAFCLALTTLFTSIPFVTYAEPTDAQLEEMDEQTVTQREIVSIESIDDLLELGDLCKNQTYSTERAFVLKADLDLSEYPNFCIPFMDGEFNGNGHTIKGLNLTEENSDYGFFRYIGENGIVLKLTVDGYVDGGENQQDISILAGNNAGIIKDCSASGELVGQTIVGAIAGLNEKTGVISNCENFAKIDGKFATGGIAGKNMGVIRDCFNVGTINSTTRINKKAPDGDGGINISLTNAAVGVAADDRANETGGIAGHSEGSILYCTNRGSIGSDQLGISTGGIVGWLCGEVTGCDNEAIVRGRNDVGGIVGCMEPRESVEFDRDYLHELDQQMDEMSDALDALRNAGEAMGDDLYANTQVLEDQVKDLKNVIRSYMDEYDRIGDDAKSGIRPQVDQIRDTVDDMNYKFHLKEIAQALKNIRGDIDAIEAILKQLTGNVTPSNGKGNSNDSEDLNKTIQEYRSILSDLRKTEERLEGEIRSSDAETFEKYYNEADYDSRNVAGAEGLDPMMLLQLSKMLKAIEAYRTDAVKNIDQILIILEKYPDKFKAIRNDMREIRDRMEDADDVLRTAIDRVDTTTDHMKGDVRPRVDSISDRFEHTADQLKYDFDHMVSAIDVVSDRASDIRTLVTDGYDELKERIDDHTTYVDSSEYMEKSAGDGKVTGCENTGEVYATSQAGGIVGSITKEARADVKVYLFRKIRSEGEEDEDEQDDAEDEKDSLTHHLQALILQNINLGDVYADSDYAGGIVGRAVYGRISECENYGDIIGNDSKYVGGIAGRAKHSIDHCYMLSGVCGTSYVGGIVGRGKDLDENYSCAYMDMDDTYVKSGGAIAGKADGSVSDNRFVDNGFGAVDGVTRRGEAEGMTYERLISLNAMPKNFKQFTIRFIDGDQVLWSSRFGYGDTFEKSQYPSLVMREGEYARWEDKKLDPVCRNVTVHSIRRVFIPSVSGCVDEGPEALIIGGNFYPDSTLYVRSVTEDEIAKIKTVKQQVNQDIHYVYSDAYRYELTQEEPYSLDQEIHVRSTSPLSNCILVLDEEMNPVGTIQAAKKNGNYLVMRTSVPMSGYMVVVDHVSKKTVAVSVIIGIILLIVLIIGLLLLRKSRKAVVHKIKTQIEEIKNE